MNAGESSASDVNPDFKVYGKYHEQVPLAIFAPDLHKKYAYRESNPVLILGRDK